MRPSGTRRPLDGGVGPCDRPWRDSTPPSTDASWRTPNHGRMIAMVVPNERSIQNAIPGNPGALLRTVPLPVDEVLVSSAAAPHVKEATNRPCREVVNDLGRRWRRGGGGQRAGGDGLNLGDMESRVHPEGQGEFEANSTGVNHSLDLERTNETGGKLGRSSLQRKVLRPKPNPLTGSVVGSR